MVNNKIMLSPCMVSENKEIYDWMVLNDTLDFIIKYLDCGLDSVEGSIFHEYSWYQPPTYTINIHNFFTTNIFPKLFELLGKGDVYSLSDLKGSVSFSINSDFAVTDPHEIELLVRYTLSINHEYVLFVGKPNYGTSGDTLDILVDKKNISIPIVKEPFTEKSSHFNSFIKKKDNEEVFVNSELCIRLDQEMQKKAMTIHGSKGSLYKQYGEIIAHRNGFKEYYPSNPYIRDTKYFIREDGKYIISIDLLHGLFEVFEGNAGKQWIAEYNFSGKKVTPSNMTRKQLEEYRRNHKVDI